MSLDILAIGAHPDDVELGVGGTLLRLVSQGARVGILDLTEGELGSRGTVEERRAEAKNAAARLGIAERMNAQLPDGGIANSNEQRHVVVEHIRALRPSIVLHHHGVDRHPDHRAAHELVRDALFFSGVGKVPGGEPHRPEHVYLYHPYADFAGEPDLIMDISDYMDGKIHALEAHRSQFHNPDYAGADTHVSSAAFWDGIRARAGNWGARIGVPYGEALHTTGPTRVETLPGWEKSE